MKIYTIKPRNFITWYYNTGADQDQSDEAIRLGNRVIEEMKDNGSSTITTQEIFDECEKSCIPVYILEEYESLEYQDGELGNLTYKWEVKLI